MKRISICFLFLVFLIPGQVSATPTGDCPGECWVDVIDFVPNVFFAGGDQGVESFTYTHDLSNDPEYDGIPIDWVLVYILRINLRDDGGDGPEWAHIDLPGAVADRVVEIGYSDVTAGVSLAGLIELNLLGTLTVTINRLSGDFWLNASRLDACGFSAPIPEPSTVLLFASMLLGGIGIRRRKR